MAVNVPGIGKVPTTPAEKQAGQREFINKVTGKQPTSSTQPMSTVTSPTPTATTRPGDGRRSRSGGAAQPMSTTETPTPTATTQPAAPTSSVYVPGIGTVPTGGASASVNDLLPKYAGKPSSPPQSTASQNVVDIAGPTTTLGQEQTTRQSLFGIGEPGFVL